MAANESIELYQFPISHYCEKIRWAPDYKGLPYKTINCLPGLHARTTQKLARHSSVPVLKHKDTAIQGSAQIIDYLEANFPDKPLNFEDKTLNEEAIQWEKFADEHIGPHVRRIMYHQLLNHPKIVIPIFSHQGPWYSPIYFKLTYPKLQHIMRKLMKINDDEVAKSKVTLANALTQLNQHIGPEASQNQTNTYLVGDRFSRADLSVSALLAPLFLPTGYGLNWPDSMPKEIEALMESYAPDLNFAKQCYANDRN